MQFSDIIGQENTKAYIHKLIQSERVPHALLLAGPEGNGKFALAMALAQRLACQNPSEHDVCGTCPGCTKYQKLEHPDLHFVYPVIKHKSSDKPVSTDFFPQWKNYLAKHKYLSIHDWMDYLDAENKQPMIYESESGAIVKKFAMKPYESEYQVMIIYMPERMNITCANKLLKLIEEPPQKSKFILVSENPQQIIATILSRCQIINIPKIDTESLTLALQNERQIDEETARSIARISNGNYVKSTEILDHNEENAYFLTQFIALMRLAYQRKIIDLKAWSDEMHSIGRERQKSFFQYALNLLRENFILNLQTPELNYLTMEEADFSTKFSRFINERNIIELLEEFDKAQMHIEQNVYAKMVFFDLSLQVILLLKS